MGMISKKGITCRMCGQLVHADGKGKEALEAQGTYHGCMMGYGTARQMQETRAAAEEIVKKHGSMFREQS